jgi:uncharacterized membrane protein YagU involved in acid resistance
VSLPTDAFKGAISGTIATIPMTAVMGALHSTLPQEREPVPPVQITASLAEKAGAADTAEDGWLAPTSLAAHFGYGAATGALYGPAASFFRLPPLAGGIIYGLAVWAVSYLGYLPALDIRKPAHQDPPQRTAMMVAAHVVWGATLGLVYSRLQRR